MLDKRSADKRGWKCFQILSARMNRMVKFCVKELDKKESDYDD